jgi:hypothetical protein
MQLTPVSSTNLHAVGYDPATSQLWVQFKNGIVYQYDRVPPETYADMMSGDCGRYFAEIIKPQRYTMPFTKLGPMPLSGPPSVADESTLWDM